MGYILNLTSQSFENPVNSHLLSIIPTNQFAHCQIWPITTININFIVLGLQYDQILIES